MHYTVLLEQFKAFIEQKQLFRLETDRLLVAVSGGVDSVVLCELCKQAGVQFAIAHCNFQLRASESERDEAFVRSLATGYSVPLFVKRFDAAAYAAENRQSIQVAARNLRYDWFAALMTDAEVKKLFDEFYNQAAAKTHQAKPSGIFTATAHHANDNIETLLMNFFKGTGINGLQGIKPVHESRPWLIRPLLFARKEQLKAFATEYQLAFVEDSSNESSKYTRNYFRNELIPSLQKTMPQVEENLLHNLERFEGISVLYQESIGMHKKHLLESKGNEVHIPVLKLMKVPALATVLYEIIREYGFSAHQTGEALALLRSDSGRYIQSPTHRMLKNRNWVIITPHVLTSANHYLLESFDDKIVFGGGELQLQVVAAAAWKLSADAAIAQLDAAAIRFPLLLRRWKEGDYFYPLGMPKKKKLSRFLIDQKQSLLQKENTWVIEMDKKIIWVVGQRIDDRFKVKPETTSLLIIRLKTADEAAAGKSSSSKKD